MTFPWQLYHWHFEVSGKCTLKCPRCPRNESVRVPWINKELTLNFFKNTLSEDILKNHAKRITMCGDIGDPIYASEYLDIIDYIKTTNSNIHIYTITNGSYKSESWWRDFAKISNDKDVINFSIDGYDDQSNNQYRINSDWDSIMQGMNIMCKESAAFVYWAAIVFKFNQDHLDTIKNLATNIGCDGLQLTYSTKFGSKYGAAYGGSNDDLEPYAKYISKTHRYERYFESLSSRVLDTTEYLKLNQTLFNTIKKQYNTFVTPMCAIGNRGLYVSADGVLHPCSWVSFPYTSMSTDRKTIEFKNSFHQRYRDLLDLNKRSLTDILQDPLWFKLNSSFSDQKSAWVECEQKCHCTLVDKEYAVGWLTN